MRRGNASQSVKRRRQTFLVHALSHVQFRARAGDIPPDSGTPLAHHMSHVMLRVRAVIDSVIRKPTGVVASASRQWQSFVAHTHTFFSNILSAPLGVKHVVAAWRAPAPTEWMSSRAFVSGTSAAHPVEGQEATAMTGVTKQSAGM